VNLTAAALALLSGAALAAAGCAIDKRAHRSSPESTNLVNMKSGTINGSVGKNVTTANDDQAAIAEHLHQLEGKIALLEHRLINGQGALRAGPNRLVDGGGQESVLERLRRIDGELAESKLTISAQQAEIAILRDQSSQALSRGDSLAAQSDALSHVKDHLMTAQQELAARKAANAALDQQVASIELQRLRVEQHYFTTVAGLLRLLPGQSQELLDLQSQVRRQIKDFQIEKGAP
jgi:hypothetical protein